MKKYYIPITADPTGKKSGVFEQLPEAALRPYIRCFWSYDKRGNKENGMKAEDTLIIPDTCMDIIFVIDSERNHIQSNFCGIDDRPGVVCNDEWNLPQVSVFGIRFYAWAAVLFSDDHMAGAKSCYCDAENYFPKLVREMKVILAEEKDFYIRAVLAQNALERCFKPNRRNAVFDTAVHRILLLRGNVKIRELTDSLPVSERQLQRIFRETAGITPKKLSELVRYQNVWFDLIHRPVFDIQDAVAYYGYTDQSHLIRVFKGFHSMTPGQAVKYAGGHVAFLQYDQTDAC